MAHREGAPDAAAAGLEAALVRMPVAFTEELAQWRPYKVISRAGGDEASHRGSYSPIVRLHNPAVDPGEQLFGEIFITGYGEITHAKLSFYPSPGLFDSSQSRITDGFRRTADGFAFGGQEHSVRDTGVTLALSGGLKLPAWDKSTMFFDLVEDEMPQISTEASLKGAAPFQFTLQTTKHSRAGQYVLQFVLTYHNGAEWAQGHIAVPFTVRNLLQRHELQRHEVLIGV